MPVTAFLNSMFFALLALFPILNPPAMAPIFFALTGGLPDSERRRLGLRIAVYSVILLTGLLLVGGWLLKLLGISVPVIGVAGGMLLFHTAWKMLNKEPRLSDSERQELQTFTADHAFFPLTMPLTAGPGSMAITLTLVPEGSIFEIHTIARLLAVVAGIALAGAAIAIFYCFAGSFIRRLGKTGEATISQISAFVLLAIGVQMVWNGIQALLRAN